jgi:hypothetical protein
MNKELVYDVISAVGIVGFPVFVLLFHNFLIDN